jgi:Spermidine/putrescine-binding periplasmic protein
VLPAALNYLGLDPDSKKPEDLAKAADVVKAVRPYIRKFHSSEYINALGRREHLPGLRLFRRHLPGARPCRQGER